MSKLEQVQNLKEIQKAVERNKEIKNQRERRRAEKNKIAQAPWRTHQRQAAPTQASAKKMNLKPRVRLLKSEVDQCRKRFDEFGALKVDSVLRRARAYQKQQQKERSRSLQVRTASMFSGAPFTPIVEAAQVLDVDNESEPGEEDPDPRDRHAPPPSKATPPPSMEQIVCEVTPDEEREMWQVKALLHALGQHPDDVEILGFFAKLTDRHEHNAYLDFETFMEFMVYLKQKHSECCGDPDLDTLEAFMSLGGGADKEGVVPAAWLYNTIDDFHLGDAVQGLVRESTQSNEAEGECLDWGQFRHVFGGLSSVSGSPERPTELPTSIYSGIDLSTRLDQDFMSEEIYTPHPLALPPPVPFCFGDSTSSLPSSTPPRRDSDAPPPRRRKSYIPENLEKGDRAAKTAQAESIMSLINIKSKGGGKDAAAISAAEERRQSLGSQPASASILHESNFGSGSKGSLEESASGPSTENPPSGAIRPTVSIASTAERGSSRPTSAPLNRGDSASRMGRNSQLKAKASMRRLRHARLFSTLVDPDAEEYPQVERVMQAHQQKMLNAAAYTCPPEAIQELVDFSVEVKRRGHAKNSAKRRRVPHSIRTIRNRAIEITVDER